MTKLVKKSDVVETLVEQDEEHVDELARLRAENAALKAQASRSVTFKVSTKGGVSVYGLGRFPLTLYKEQWEKLNDVIIDVMAFINSHAKELKTRG